MRGVIVLIALALITALVTFGFAASVALSAEHEQPRTAVEGDPDHQPLTIEPATRRRPPCTETQRERCRREDR